MRRSIPPPRGQAGSGRALRDKLERVAGRDALVLAGDLLERDARERAVQSTLAHFGRIDVLVNNAGVGLYAPTWKAPMDEVRGMFELNFFAAVEMTQLAVPHMLAQKSGTIVNVSSIAGKGAPWFTLYTASKYALSGMTDGLRIDCAGTAFTACWCARVRQNRLSKQRAGGQAAG